MDEKTKRRVVAIAKQLKEKKNFVVNQQEVNKDIVRYKKAQQDILKVKEQYKGIELVEKEADSSHKKLQDIIDGLNEYMRVLHPAGLLDMGSGSSGKSVVGQG